MLWLPLSTALSAALTPGQVHNVPGPEWHAAKGTQRCTEEEVALEENGETADQPCYSSYCSGPSLRLAWPGGFKTRDGQGAAGTWHYMAGRLFPAWVSSLQCSSSVSNALDSGNGQGTQGRLFATASKGGGE